MANFFLKKVETCNFYFLISMTCSYRSLVFLVVKMLHDLDANLATDAVTDQDDVTLLGDELADEVLGGSS